jgi:lipopolysaccharide transport system ATP-binding protein
MKPMIELKDIHKAFKLSHQGSASLKTALLWWKRRQFESLNVLNGLTFTIRQGEAAAIVGRNGAGKSTMLSIIARVYKPDSGSVMVGGRIAPLLELGAGFHPDLTGQENVIFNGMILGLSRRQIRERVGDILAFAELERHADAPVRTYSSGMLARLGFSVAAHVDADILIVDEVLAVGDFAFEQKCYDTIGRFQANGGTILFVSHNMDHVKKVATRCLWLEGGLVRQDGPPEEVIEAYHRG